MIEMSNDNNNITDIKGIRTASTQTQLSSESPKQLEKQSLSQTTPSSTSTTTQHCSQKLNNNERQSNGIAIDSLRASGLHIDHVSMMGKAEEASRHSEDPVTKVGACLVDAQHHFVSTGYNKFPPNNSGRPYPWTKNEDNQLEDKRTYVLHAEAVAIMEHRTANLNGATLYSTLMPCNECAKLIIMAGIKQVYYLHAKENCEWKYQASHRMFDAAGVELTQLKK